MAEFRLSQILHLSTQKSVCATNFGLFGEIGANFPVSCESLTVKATTLIFIPVRGSAISSAKEGKSGSIYNLVKNYNPFLVYCRELAPGTVSLTRDRAQGDDSKHDSHYFFFL